MKKRNKRKAKGRSLFKVKENGQGRKVHFIFQAPEAKEVYLAGEFNEWHTQALPLFKGGNGGWNVAVELSIGRHEYKLFVDGAWVEDRPCEVFVTSASGKRTLESEPVLNSYGTVNFAIWV
jgi:1,4-alpha-glucan branching enzyme